MPRICSCKDFFLRCEPSTADLLALGLRQLISLDQPDDFQIRASFNLKDLGQSCRRKVGKKSASQMSRPVSTLQSFEK